MKSKSRSFRVLLIVLVLALGDVGQAQARQRAASIGEAQARQRAASINAATTVVKEWRTPWGDPDLQGSWSNATTTPLERPARYAGREFLTPEERQAQDRQTAIGTDRRATPGTDDYVNGAYNAFWWERGLSDGRTSLIYDPPDGRIPRLSSDKKKQREDFSSSGPYNGPEQLSLYV